MSKDKNQLTFDLFPEAVPKQAINVVKPDGKTDFELVLWSIQQFGDTVIGYNFIKSGLLRFDDNGNEIETLYYIDRYHDPDEQELKQRKFYEILADKILNQEVTTLEQFKTFEDKFKNL